MTNSRDGYSQNASGRSLAQVVATEGTWTPEDAARLGLQIVEALETAHEAGIVHGDVTPSNVVIGPDGDATLVGFPPIDAVDQPTGSAGYVAPERITPGPLSSAVDLFGLGATLFFAVDGHSPFDGEDARASAFAAAIQPHPHLDDANPLAPVIGGLLDKDPQMRLTSTVARTSLQAVIAAGGALSNDDAAVETTADATPDEEYRQADITHSEPESADSGFAESEPALPELTESEPAEPELAEPELPHSEVVQSEAGHLESTQLELAEAASTEPAPGRHALVDPALTMPTSSVGAEPAPGDLPSSPDDGGGSAKRPDGAAMAALATGENRFADFGDGVGATDSPERDEFPAAASSAGVVADDAAKAPKRPRHSAAASAADGGGRSRRGRMTVLVGVVVAIVVLAGAGITYALGGSSPSPNVAAQPTTAPIVIPSSTPPASPTSPASSAPPTIAAAKITRITVNISKGDSPQCQATATATVHVSAGPITVRLSTNVNGAYGSRTVTFGPGGAQSKQITVGSSSDAVSGTVRVSASAPNTVSATQGWNAVPACATGFTVGRPHVQCTPGGGLQVSVTIYMHRAANPTDVSVQVAITDGFNHETDFPNTVTLQPQGTQTVTVQDQDFHGGGYHVAVTSTDASQVFKSNAVVGSCQPSA